MIIYIVWFFVTKQENYGKSLSKNIRTLNVFGMMTKTSNYSTPKIINTTSIYGAMVYAQYSMSMIDVC